MNYSTANSPYFLWKNLPTNLSGSMLNRAAACALPAQRCQHKKRRLFYKKRHFSVCHNSTSHCKKKQIRTRLNCFLQRFNVRSFMILQFSLTEMQQHILLVDKVDNIGVTFQVPGSFWSGLSGVDRKKKWEGEILSWDPNYQWPKGKHPPDAFQMQVKENTGELRTYAISETQFKGYAENIVSLLLLLNKPVVMVTFLRNHRDRRTRHLLQVHQQLLGHQRSVCLASDLQSRDQECTITF